jgi:ABC-type branched-subunit amino acid transport system ATPase component
MSLLQVKNIFSGYGVSEVLHGVSIQIEKNEVVTIIGPNGAGKSTLLKTIMGYLIPFRGKILFEKEDTTLLKPYERVLKGIGYVPQLENVFPSLTVQENLEMGGYVMHSRKLDHDLSKVFKLLPFLKKKKGQKAGTLSGGERQMLAIGRALMTRPRLLLLDEPSAGLAPNISTSVFDRIKDVHQTGTAIIIVEQDAYQSLRISDRGYVLAMGQNEFEDEAHKILGNEKIRKAFLGG